MKNEVDSKGEILSRNFRIGFDLDQVITNQFELLLLEFNEKYQKRFSLEDIKNYYYLETIIEAERLEDLRSLYSHEDLFANASPIADSQVFINKLLSDGHNIHFISTRRPHLKKITVEWLSRFDFPVTNNNVHLRETTDENSIEFKLRKIKELGLNIFVEDDSRVAEKLDIPVVLLDYAWNREVEKNNIHRVHDWSGIYNQIMKISMNEG